MQFNMGLWKVYKITNQSSGRAYIGITSKQIEMRFREHLEQAKEGSRLHKNGTRYALHAALVKYGAERFDLVELKKGLDLDSARRLEVELIQKHNTYASARNLPNLPRGYNETLGGEMPDAGELAYAANLERQNASAAKCVGIKLLTSAPIAHSRQENESPSVYAQEGSQLPSVSRVDTPSTPSPKSSTADDGSNWGYIAFAVLAIIAWIALG
jgi:hypothetical protein